MGLERALRFIMITTKARNARLLSPEVTEQEAQSSSDEGLEHDNCQAPVMVSKVAVVGMRTC